MEYRRRVREVLKVRCRHLCTKAGAFPLPEPEDEENAFDTTIWWCARTTEALGPDGSSAAPGDCDGPGRECYRAPGAT
jgi:hypothetical protein